MKKLKELYEEYLNSVDKKFTDKNSRFYLSSGFYEWLGDKYKEDWVQLSKDCGFLATGELKRNIFNLTK